MNLIHSAILAGSISIAGLSGAQATTLTFEDLDPSPASFDVMPATYSDLNFTGWFYGPDTTYTPSSGTIDLFTDYADPNDPNAYVITVNNSISATIPFVFDGATFSGFSGVTLELYIGGTLVHTSSSLPDAPGLTAYAPTLLSSGYSDPVDTVKVKGVQGYYSMDDFTYHVAAAVPEPSTYAMFIAGIGLVGALARKQKAR